MIRYPLQEGLGHQAPTLFRWENTLISRFLTLGSTPELRLEPQSSDNDNQVPEIELALDIEAFWELSSLLQQFRYAKESGHATKQIWKKISKFVLHAIVTERDRTWFLKNKAS